MARRLLVLLLAFVIGLAACTTAAPPRGNGSALVADSGPLDAVVKRTFTAYGFRLQSGRVLPEMALAYETYGRLAPDGRNAILITHGGTSSGHAAGKYSPSDGVPGWWDGLIGPGKAIDTNRYFVVASNVLGSSYGSTAPASRRSVSSASRPVTATTLSRAAAYSLQPWRVRAKSYLSLMSSVICSMTSGRRPAAFNSPRASSIVVSAGETPAPEMLIKNAMPFPFDAANGMTHPAWLQPSMPT